jgi:hypothetical protein
MRTASSASGSVTMTGQPIRATHPVAPRSGVIESPSSSAPLRSQIPGLVRKAYLSGMHTKSAHMQLPPGKCAHNTRRFQRTTRKANSSWACIACLGSLITKAGRHILDMSPKKATCSSEPPLDDGLSPISRCCMRWRRSGGWCLKTPGFGLRLPSA